METGLGPNGEGIENSKSTRSTSKKTHTYSKKSLGENSESIENGKSTTKSTHAVFELECWEYSLEKQANINKHNLWALWAESTKSIQESGQI